MRHTNRRGFLAQAASLGISAPFTTRLTLAAEPATGPHERPNLLYGLSTGSWGRVVPPGQPLPLLQILDETAAAGFNGVRLTGFPDILDRNGMSLDRYGQELTARGLRFSTVSFGGEYFNADRHAAIRQAARAALAAHRRFGATAMVFFPPSPVAAEQESEALRSSFSFLNELGKMAWEEFGVRMGLHNHTDSLIENQRQVDRFLEGTDPRFVFCAWDTAHLLLGGCDVQDTFRRSIDRIVYTDFKDAVRDPPAQDYLSPNGERFAADSRQGRFFNSMWELGKGEIDFLALMRLLAGQKYRGWINHDLDTIRVSTPESWRVSMDYIRARLDPIYQ